MGFTENQLKAIELRNRDILVSAAAGSGKTSVLVERIIQRICDEKPVAYVDRLLIMTFTNAAAAEMKERIRDAIENRLDDVYQKRSEGGIQSAEFMEYFDNLQKQSVLVHNAKITTIHGFCQSIIRDHFEEIGIDPNFRVADENECKLLKMDSVAECFEEAYKEASESFLHTVECFSGNKNDSGLTEIVLKLYNFSMASPEPEKFLENCLSVYQAQTLEDFLKLDCVQEFLTLKAEKIQGFLNVLERAYKLIDETAKIEGYRVSIDELRDCLTSAEKALVDGDMDKAGCCLKGFSASRLKAIGDKGLDESEIVARDCVKDIRAMVNKGIEELAQELKDPAAVQFEKVSACRENVEVICNLVTSFKENYAAKKRDKKIIDFNDMEHMALEILTKNQEVANIYRDNFDEIYVDEYQDSNLTQEILVNLIKREEGNVFTVGDVKQSIYRFRMARPDLFIEKYDTYTDENSKQQRVLLNDNFRSRREVVDAVNEIFTQIMKKDFGKIEYDESAMLRYGATYYDECGEAGTCEEFESCENSKTGVTKKEYASPYKAEIIIGTSEELSDEEFQANAIAGRINSMIKGKMQVYDKNLKALRDIRFSDCVILVRSLKKWEETLRTVLGGAVIPVSVTGSEGYFATTEVRTALAFLSVVDNPYQDIPLAAVMRSPVGGFSDEDLAALGANREEKGTKIGALYLRLKSCEIPGIKEKCESLVALIGRYRDMSENMQVSELLRKFIDEEYGDFVRVMNKGVQRIANLNMLLTKAEDFGRTSFKGLYHFMRYIDQIKKYEVDYGEAGVLGEADDIVRIMTIHKSKGLEFPVCFVAGCEKSRNTGDERNRIIWDVNYGIGCDYVDLENRVKKPTLIKSLIKEQLFRENLAEEMRVLYVAMTRAREKLIMVATPKKDPFEKLPAGIDKCSSFLDMLAYAYKKESGDEALEEGLDYFDITYETEADILTSRITSDIINETGRETILEMVRESLQTTSVLFSEVNDRLKFSYTYYDRPNMAQKLSVSDLKHRAIEEKRALGEELVQEGKSLFPETEPDKYIPKFMRQEGQTQKGGTFYGTAFHRILELWDYSIDTVKALDISDFATIMLERNRLDVEQADAINGDDVAFFLNSPLGRRMKRAHDNKTLYREQPFVLGVSAKEVYPQYYENTENAGYIPEVLVQGIIDAYFIEDDGITIVDYKTDSVNDAQILINRYRAQLEYYGMALSKITGMKIKALTIYSSRLRKEIVVG